MLLQILFTKKGDTILQNGKKTSCSSIIEQANAASLREGSPLKETEAQREVRKMNFASLKNARKEFCEPPTPKLTNSEAPSKPDPLAHPEPKNEYKVTNGGARFSFMDALLGRAAGKPEK